MPKGKSTKNEYLVKPPSKATLEKESIKLLLTPKEKADLEKYSELTKVKKNEIVALALKRMMKADKKLQAALKGQTPTVSKPIPPTVITNPVTDIKREEHKGFSPFGKK